MDEFILIGLDGGASKVLAQKVEVLTNPLRFTAVKPTVEVSYRSSDKFNPDFKPIPLNEQLKDLQDKRIRPSKAEQQQEEAILDSFVKVLKTICSQQSNTPELLLGVGMPGLKTQRKRGIAAMANGPRMPNFLSHLEARLEKAGLPTVQKVPRLGSDADYCGLGERYGQDGAFRGVDNALYIGVGTGIADAMMLSGRLIPFDEARDWIAKTWEILDDDGRSLEVSLSAPGIQQNYANKLGMSLENLMRRKIYPWQIYELAKDQDPVAMEVVEQVAQKLSSLIYQRIVTLSQGDQGTKLVKRDRRLNPDHPYRGMVFERIVIGQRLGEIWEFEDFKHLLRNKVKSRLASLIQHSTVLPKSIKDAYLTSNKRLPEELIVGSQLRHSAALGAAIDAYLHWAE